MADPKTYTLQTAAPSQNFKIDYSAELNEQQLPVVYKGDGPCLVLAGAGSGKTRTLVYRVAFLLERGVPADRILLMTFTNKAAKEMMERVEQLLGSKPKGLWGGTFHSIANRLLQQYADQIGFQRNFSILDSDDQQKFLTQIQKELSIPKESYIPKTRVIRSIISFTQNSQLSVREVIERSYSYLLPDVIPIIERVNDAYQQKKQEGNLMDFDDLLSKMLELLSLPELGPRISQQFEYVLVDEFQDTNTVQAKIVQRLAAPQNNLLVVGDDAQSIYSFRAATVENILSFQQVYPQAAMYKLEINYRSTSDILALANASIRNNQFQYDKSLKSRVGHGAQQKPVLVPARDAQQQAEFIAQRVLELRDEGYSMDQMAVLFRSSFQIIEMELELNRRGIPYLVRGGLRFFEQAHIKDVLAYLQIMHNPRDEVSWRRVLGMYEGVGPATATKIWQRLKAHDTLTAMLSELAETQGRGKSAESIARLQRFFFKLLEVPAGRVHTLITTILEEGYQVVLERVYEDAKDRLEDLHQLALFASQYGSLADFLSEAQLSEGFKGERAGASEDTPDEILVLSTIHQAKGLEWDVVFAIGLAEGQFPHYKVAEKPKEIEEERRLFYVAATRPRKLLYLIYPITSRSYGMGEVIHRPSMFIREINEDLMETWQISEYRNHAVLSFRDESKDLDYVDEDAGSSDNDGGSIFDMLRGI